MVPEGLQQDAKKASPFHGGDELGEAGGGDLRLIIISSKSLNTEYTKYPANEEIDINTRRIILETNGTQSKTKSRNMGRSNQQNLQNGVQK